MVTIYSRTTCQPCRITKQALTKKGIDYVEKNIEEDPVAYEEVIALGYQAVPVVVTPTGESWSGLRPDKIAALQAA